VILLRKIILRAIEAVQKRQPPKGLPPPQDADELLNIDSFTGVRAKGWS
jgi:hypothetical protein